jgi:hypothetical protein
MPLLQEISIVKRNQGIVAISVLIILTTAGSLRQGQQAGPPIQGLPPARPQEDNNTSKKWAVHKTSLVFAFHVFTI